MLWMWLPLQANAFSGFICAAVFFYLYVGAKLECMSWQWKPHTSQSDRILWPKYHMKTGIFLMTACYYDPLRSLVVWKNEKVDRKPSKGQKQLGLPQVRRHVTEPQKHFDERTRRVVMEGRKPTAKNRTNVCGLSGEPALHRKFRCGEANRKILGPSCSFCYLHAYVQIFQALACYKASCSVSFWSKNDAHFLRLERGFKSPCVLLAIPCIFSFEYDVKSILDGNCSDAESTEFAHFYFSSGVLCKHTLKLSNVMSSDDALLGNLLYVSLECPNGISLKWIKVEISQYAFFCRHA